MAVAFFVCIATAVTIIVIAMLVIKNRRGTQTVYVRVCVMDVLYMQRQQPRCLLLVHRGAMRAGDAPIDTNAVSEHSRFLTV